MRTILVTGRGVYWLHLVYYLAEKYPDDRVVVLDALTYAGSTENLPASMYPGKVRTCISGMEMFAMARSSKLSFRRPTL